jgi:hypothetical protein
MSIVILNRGGRLFRESALDELPDRDVYEVISVEGPEAAPEIELLVKKYPHVRFLLLHAPCTAGERVNLGIEEAQAKLVLVCSSDLHIPQPAFSKRLLETIETRNVLCTLPILKNHKLETIPSIHVPGFFDKRLKLVPWNPLYDGMKSIYAFDYTGIYNKEKYRFSGGYDAAIRSPYWQKVDFGFRGYLWGEEFSVNTSFYFQYRAELPLEDSTPDEGYKLFYLKNISVDFRRDKGVLGFRNFLRYFIKSNSSFFRALKEYRFVQRWVFENRYRFKTDARSLIELWQAPE